MVKLIKSAFYNEKETKKRLSDFVKEAEKLSIGSECEKFEKSFAKWQGREHCIMFNSGSSANLALIQALINLNILHVQDAVGFSALTWSTNVMPLLQCSLKPIPVDINPNTLNISVETLEQTQKQTPFRALFLTNLLGFSDDIAKIKSYCEKHNILLLEDNCESLGSAFNEIRLGNFGFASTFSFYIGHHLSTIEGGAVCTDDSSLNTMLRMVRSHGWDRHLPEEEQKRIRAEHGVDDFYGMYTFYDLGFNLRPTEIQGFVGNEQMQYVDAIVESRENNFEKLKNIYQNDDIETIQSLMSINSNFAFPVVCKTTKLRDYYVQKCMENDIEIRPIVGGLMTQHPFFKKYSTDTYELPSTEKIHQCGFYVGNNPDMTSAEVNSLIAVLAKR